MGLFDQRDKAGRSYTTHLARVYERLIDNLGNLPHEQWNETFQICWLHDVIEDTSYDGEHLAVEGFAPRVIQGVEALTGPGANYLAWVERHGGDARHAAGAVFVPRLARPRSRSGWPKANFCARIRA